MNPLCYHGYSSVLSAMNSEARLHTGSPTQTPWWASYALLSVLGDEDGPESVGQIRDFGEGLAILSHQFRGETWTRVYRREG